MKKVKLIGYKDQPFYYYSYEVDKADKMMIIAHGVAEDARRYDYFARKLNEEGFNVYVISHIAHGEDCNLDDLGVWHKGDFDGCLMNINYLYKDVIEKNIDNLKILFGHSMGSFMVQKYQLMYKNNFDKLILCGCAMPNFKYKLGRFVISFINIFKSNKRVPGFEKMSFGSFNKKFENETSVDWLSKNKDNRQYYIDSPYCGFVCTAGFYKEFYKNVSKIPNGKYKKLYSKDYPILLIGGSMDMVSECSKLLIKLANFYKKQSDKVTYKIYEGDRHEILNEDDKDLIIKDIIDFVNNNG
ncbi:MAG: alpha/beta fold hydrolase [Acholeplasmatales bacterium]|nr:alpha/beta fold hydrolase [Acholeplasmatales bacterium]